MASAVVVGGGPAGLTVAVALAEAGHTLTLLESSSRLGGMAASITVDGVRCDLGSHRLHPVPTPAVERLLVDLQGGDLQLRPRNGRIALAGRWLRFPLRPADVVRALPPSFADDPCETRCSHQFERTANTNTRSTRLPPW